MQEFYLLSQIGALTIIFLMLSGIIKGAIGFGQPLVAISLLTLIHSVEVSLALISLSLVATNLKLALSGGHAGQTVRTFGFVILAIILGTFCGVAAISYVNKFLVQFMLGAVVVVFVVLGFLNFKLNKVEPNGPAGIGIGALAGAIGGITSAFGPLLALFLKSQDLKKDQFVSMLCFLILSGAITLSVSLGLFRIYSPDSFFYAILACIPTFLGLWLGEKIRLLIDADIFFKAVSAAILVVGLNLVRSGLSGMGSY